MGEFKLLLSVFIVSAFLVAAGCSNQNADVAVTTETLQTPSTADTIPEPARQTPDITAVAATPVASAKATVSVESIPEEITNLSYSDTENYNAFFFKNISADLDGDGKEETIKLYPGKNEDNGPGKSVTVSAAGNELRISAENGWHIYDDVLYPYGTVLDIDKNDGRKEIMIEEQIDDYSPNEISNKAVIIIYTDGKLQTVGGWGMPVEANGTGYVTFTKYSKVLKGGYSIGLQGVLRYLTETGFEEINLDKYTAQSYTGSAEYTFETVSDAKAAKKPGGEKNIIIKKGSEIYFGFYNPLGWIEVNNSGGENIGWIDLNEVDIDNYIGYAIEQSCH